jgi:thiol:disulfide interchange protein DsbC
MTRRIFEGIARALQRTAAASRRTAAAFHRTAAALSLLALPVVAVAQVDPAVEKQLRERMTLPVVGLAVESVETSEIPGMYRVQLQDGPEVYATEDGEFFVLGDLYSVTPTGLVNLAEVRRSEQRLADIEAVALQNQIVFPASGETKSHITVFTDVSCFYCQKLHKEVPELNRRGVEVRYLAYPRQGIGSAGFRQLATAWCAEDPQTTLTRMKNRESVDENVCAGNPVAAQFELGQAVGVRGTPAIVMPDGSMVPGYRSADDLVAALGIE